MHDGRSFKRRLTVCPLADWDSISRGGRIMGEREVFQKRASSSRSRLLPVTRPEEVNSADGQGPQGMILGP
jgi:hypothetical protein